MSSAFRVVTDVEREMEAGLAPRRSSPAVDRETLLEPLTVRERALVCGVADALKALGVLTETPELLGVWKTLGATFAMVTGVAWPQASSWW